MTLTGFEVALDHTNEIELTTTGRVTGKPISCPVWFVKRGGKLYLVPGDGTDSQWYKNLLKTPAVRLILQRHFVIIRVGGLVAGSGWLERWLGGGVAIGTSATGFEVGAAAGSIR